MMLCIYTLRNILISMMLMKNILIYIFRNEVTNNITKILVIDFMKNKYKLKEVLHQYNISYDEGDIILNGYK